MGCTWEFGSPLRQPIIGYVYSETSVYVVGDEFVHVFLFFSLLFFLFVKGYFQDDDMIGPRLHYGLWGRLLQGVFSPPVDQSSVNYVFVDSFYLPLPLRPVEGSSLLVIPLHYCSGQSGAMVVPPGRILRPIPFVSA